MMPILLLLFTLVSLEPVFGYGNMPGTTNNFDSAFQKKCKTFKTQIRPNSKDCTELLTLFKNIWVGKDPCSVAKTAYKPFTDAASVTIPKGKSLFWSGAKAVAQKVAQRGWNMWTLEGTFIGSLLDGLIFCGQPLTDKDNTGINYKECPGWMSCTNHAMRSFWNAASQWFAKSASGPITVVLGGWRKPAYATTSIFKTIELPALTTTGHTAVTKVDVWMVDEKISNCKEDSVGRLLKNEVVAKGFTFMCKDNPNLFGKLTDVRKNAGKKTVVTKFIDTNNWANANSRKLNNEK